MSEPHVPSPVSPRVPRPVYAFLAIGLVAASQSGNLVRIGDAPPVAMAAWRLALASVLMTALAGRHLRGLLALRPRDRLFLVLAGAALSMHLTTWIAAVQRTTVANAAIFFATNPVLTATAAYWFFGEKPTIRLALAVVLGLAGVVVIGLDDFGVSRNSAVGDLFAVGSSLLFTVYFLLGKALRPKLDNRAYVAGIYGVAAFVGFALFPVLGLSFAGYGARNWLAFVLLALVPTALGHTSLNAALRYMDASSVSAATLVEPVLAGFVAWLAWSETIRLSAAAGYVLISLSVLVLVWEHLRPQGASEPTATPVEVRSAEATG